MGRKAGQIVARSQCASTSIYVLGLCRRSYIRDGVDRRRFAGLREQVLERDEHRCRGFQAGSIDTKLAPPNRPLFAS